MASEIRLKVQNALHRAALRITGGRAGTRVAGMPTLELTTVGRRSGRSHTVVLMAPVIDGETIVVVASRAGDSKHPAWFLNLRDTLLVEVAWPGGRARPMLARVASERERTELWPKVTAQWRGFARFQRRTSRAIPVVLLEPGSARDSASQD